jgi:hypothetical protein
VYIRGARRSTKLTVLAVIIAFVWMCLVLQLLSSGFLAVAVFPETLNTSKQATVLHAENRDYVYWSLAIKVHDLKWMLFYFPWNATIHLIGKLINSGVLVERWFNLTVWGWQWILSQLIDYLHFKLYKRHRLYVIVNILDTRSNSKFKTFHQTGNFTCMSCVLCR